MSSVKSEVGYPIGKSRIEYLEAMKKFKESEAPLIAVAISNVGGVEGWTVSRGDITLPNSRGKLKVVKRLDGVASIAKSYGLDSFEVRGF